jgi:hypothetical protein
MYMPRAKIPYDELQDELEKMYPFPVYRNPRIRPKSVYKGYTPITVYDRSKGNFATIGYRAMIEFSRFQGEYDSVMNPVFRQEMKEVVILLN